MTKHTPATPLPWRDLKIDGAFLVLHAENGRVTSLHYATGVKAQHDCQRQDAAYIAHAANAYQKLVVALRNVVQTQDALEISEAAALLRELGEIE